MIYIIIKPKYNYCNIIIIFFYEIIDIIKCALLLKERKLEQICWYYWRIQWQAKWFYNYKFKKYLVRFVKLIGIQLWGG